MSGARILIVDDDVAILRALSRTLESHGYAVSCEERAAPVLAALKATAAEVLLLDLVLPDGDGTELTRAIRQVSDVPIIVMSAVGDDQRKVQALDEGADDYVTKPFSTPELEARIRVVLRRHRGLAMGAPFKAGPLTIDLDRHVATVGGTPVHLTPKEFELCRALLEGRGKLLTQRLLLTRVWGPEYADDAHILRTFIHQLRRKLDEALPGAGQMIVNDPGVGYRIVEP